MPSSTQILGVAAVAAILATGAARGETLKVGPGQKFAVPSAAFRVAKDGDTIEIDAAGAYGGDVAKVGANGLTIRGVGGTRAKLPAQGKHYGGKAIWVTTGNDLTVENIEFSGARVPDGNGAGIRAEGKNLTLRNCRFDDCEDGILGGAGEMLIASCEFDHCGPPREHATHSLYIGGNCTRLTFRGNYSTRTGDGHLLKSRARENWILYNRLTDEQGNGSAVVDLPNGGYAVIVGNLLHKGAKGNNDRVIAYGMEGITHDRNGLYVVNNTMVYEHRHTNSSFVRVEKVAADFVPVIRNNLCMGKIPLTNAAAAETAGNLLFPTASEAGLADPARYDFRLTVRSPGIDKGVSPGKAGEFDLAPESQYVHRCRVVPRPQVGLIDVGAYEYSPPGPTPASK